MFSRRTAFELDLNPLTVRIRQLCGAGRDPIDLTVSNPTLAGLPYPETEIVEAFDAREALVYRPTPAGLEETRRAVCEYYRERGAAIEPENVVLTASTSEAYTHLFKLLADPGDAVLIPSPSYPLFQYLALLESLQTIPFPLHYLDRWTCDLDELARLSRRRQIFTTERTDNLIPFAGCFEQEVDYLPNGAVPPFGTSHIVDVVLDEVGGVLGRRRKPDPLEEGNVGQVVADVGDFLRQELPFHQKAFEIGNLVRRPLQHGLNPEFVRPLGYHKAGAPADEPDLDSHLAGQPNRQSVID